MIGMELEKVEKKVIEFRDARDPAQFQGQRSDVGAGEIRGQAMFKEDINEKKCPVEKAKGSARKYAEP